MSQRQPPSSSPLARVILSLGLPIAGSLLFSLAAGGSPSLGGQRQGETALQLAGVGLVSWFLGLRWYRLPGMGLRGGRPLYAGIGFAALGWIAFLAVRFVTVEISSFGAADAGRTFIYLLLFEALSVQLWTFGLFFRSVADWRGGLTAAVSGGVLFGAVASLTFQESLVSPGLGMLNLFSALYFTAWGILYGVIRLRTGSLLGTVIIQTMQSWTAWQIMVPVEQPVASELRNLYLICTFIYAILIWRLWPKREEDYRV